MIEREKHVDGVRGWMQIELKSRKWGREWWKNVGSWHAIPSTSVWITAHEFPVLIFHFNFSILLRFLVIIVAVVVVVFKVTPFTLLDDHDDEMSQREKWAEIVQVHSSFTLPWMNSPSQQMGLQITQLKFFRIKSTTSSCRHDVKSWKILWKGTITVERGRDLRFEWAVENTKS